MDMKNQNGYHMLNIMQLEEQRKFQIYFKI